MLNMMLALILINVEFISSTARSPVFNAMFEHEMEESKKVRITGYSCGYGCSFIRIHKIK